MTQVNVERSYDICAADGFPMLKIQGRLRCVREYIDRCIGQKRVIDLIQRYKTTYYIFENCYELPILCFCCGSPVPYDNLEQSRRDMRGRRLESISVNMGKIEGRKEIVKFQLHFSGKWFFSKKIDLIIAPEAILSLRQIKYTIPPPKRQQPSAKKKQLGKRKRRKK